MPFVIRECCFASYLSNCRFTLTVNDQSLLGPKANRDSGVDFYKKAVLHRFGCSDIKLLLAVFAEQH